MSLHLPGRMDPHWRPTGTCLPGRGRVFLVLLVVVMLFVVVLTGQGYDPPTALGVVAAAGAVAAEYLRRFVWPYLPARTGKMTPGATR